jgi:hypothetical protein
MLRRQIETKWMPQMIQLFGLTRETLPIVGDANFLFVRETQPVRILMSCAR